MKERPILFSAPMVRALLAGTKTQTRRLVKSPHVEDADIWAHHKDDVWESGLGTDAPGSFGHGEYVRCPYGIAGDRLWVRETWAPRDAAAIAERDRKHVFYRADDETRYKDDGSWRPSIHMPRWASRLTLEVTSVRIERLMSISERDARAEGVEPVVLTYKSYPSKYAADVEVYSHHEGFVRLWTQINGKRAPWATNPWVWVLELRRVDAAAARAA